MSEYETHEFQSGDVLFKEGEDSNTGYIVLSGSIELSKRGHMKVDVAEIVRDGFFGLLPMIDGKPRNYTAKAREKTVCMVIPRQVFLKLLNNSDPIIQAALHNLTRSLRQATSRLTTGGVLDHSRGDTN